MATSTIANFESGHVDMVHDASFDYYGKRLATCSSDRTIKVFDVAGEQVTHVADLAGHEGAVWAVSWAHPKFGSLLASCGFDNRVIIWKEVSDRVWQQLYVSTLHTASVNSLCWAPYELGLVLAAASSDGSLSVLTHQQDGSWLSERIDGAHPAGANAVSWAPAAPKGSLVGSKPPGQPVRRLASCGCDNAVKIWTFDETSRHWKSDGAPLMGHSDWARDVAWAPNLGLPMSTIASCGQDGRLLAWNEKEDGSGWESVVIHEFENQAVWRLSWSTSGNVLAATTADGATTLWKEATDGRWQQVGE